MKQSPFSQAYNHLASQEILRLLWTPLSWARRIQSTLLPYFPEIHSNVTVPSSPTSSETLLPFRFSDKNFVCIPHLFHACYMPRPSHSPRFYHPNVEWWSVEVMENLITPPTKKLENKNFGDPLLGITSTSTDSTTANLSDIRSKFRAVAMFMVAGMWSVGMFVVSEPHPCKIPRAKIQRSVSQFVIATKTESKYIFHTVTILLIYILQRKKLHIFRSITT
jgi:hypothetical protein